MEANRGGSGVEVLLGAANDRLIPKRAARLTNRRKSRSGKVGVLCRPPSSPFENKPRPIAKGPRAARAALLRPRTGYVAKGGESRSLGASAGIRKTSRKTLAGNPRKSASVKLPK